jgi:hypothetical protein
MYWAVKSRHWSALRHQDDPTFDRDRLPFLGAGGLEIVVAWAIAMGIFLILLVSSMPS